MIDHESINNDKRLFKSLVNYLANDLPKVSQFVVASMYQVNKSLDNICQMANPYFVAKAKSVMAIGDPRDLDYLVQKSGKFKYFSLEQLQCHKSLVGFVDQIKSDMPDLAFMNVNKSEIVKELEARVSLAIDHARYNTYS